MYPIHLAKLFHPRKLTMKEDNLLKIIFNFFVDSHDFNGIPLTNLSKETKISYLELIERIQNLVIKELVSIQTDENPHIIRFSSLRQRNTN